MALFAVLILLTYIFTPINSIAIDNGVVEGSGDGEFRLPVQNDQVKCNVRQRPADIMFLVDGSSSVGQENFNRMIDFIRNLIDGFVVSPKVVQIGLTQFSGEVRPEFALNEHYNHQAIFQRLRSITYLEGSTNTGKALMHVLNKDLTPAKGIRPNVPQMVIIITDGASQDEVSLAAGEAARRGIDVFAVAITPDINESQLLELVGGIEDRVFKVPNFRDLQTDIINKIVEEVCMAVDFRDVAPSTSTSGSGPSVQCRTEGILFSAQSQRPFGGKIYIKGYYDNERCREVADTGRPSTDIKFTVPMDGCGMRRVRSLNPAGVSCEATIIVSFHPVILTKVDRAYRIKCFFMEAEKMVSSNIDVSMLPTTDLMDQAPMPTCSYTIRSQSQDGPVARYANVGDKIYHVWECKLGAGGYTGPSEDSMHAALVHSCTADDGSGNIVQVLDSRGCAIDPVVLQNLIYEGSLTRAYQETHAYKFADRTALYFQCQISLCLKMEPECLQTVPPVCSAGPNNANSYEGPSTARRSPRPSGYIPESLGVDINKVDYQTAVIGSVDAYTQVDVLEGAGPDPFDSAFSSDGRDMSFQSDEPHDEAWQPYVAKIRHSPLGLNFSQGGNTFGIPISVNNPGEICMTNEVIIGIMLIVGISLLVLTCNCIRLFQQANLKSRVYSGEYRQDYPVL